MKKKNQYSDYQSTYEVIFIIIKKQTKYLLLKKWIKSNKL